MKNPLFTFVGSHRKLLYGLILTACLLNGIAIALLIHDRFLDMGDGSTFYAFARNIARGEVIYKDFIHFRTPGSYFIQALFIKLFGEQQSSVTFAIRFETMVLYPITFLAAAIIIFRSKKNPGYSLISLLGIVFLPGLIQLRAGLALLAVSCYFASYELKKYEKHLLFITGLLVGVTLIFGQETAIMAFVCIAAGELIGRKRGRLFWERLKLLLGGAFLGALPLLIYVLFASSFTNFLYYTTYYSFILQPKFMNTPFPGLGWSNMVYYLPFILYTLCLFILFTSSKFGKKEGVLLSFGILRLITALGRSDLDHLIFAIPEIFIIVPLFLSGIKHASISGARLLRFLPYGLSLIGLFTLAIIVNSVFLILAPFLILIAKTNKPIEAIRRKSTLGPRVWVGACLAVCLAWFVYLIFPVYRATYRVVDTEFKLRKTPAQRVGGVKAKPDDYKEILDMNEALKGSNIQTIFNFPIQPFYYSLAPKHASRYLTFEPQTTIAEQEKTIYDLEVTQPEVIIFDPTQAELLSGSLWKISDHIFSNYQFHKQVLNKNMLWVMTPKGEQARENFLVFQLFKENKPGRNVKGVQNREAGIINAIMHFEEIKFVVDNPSNSSIVTSIIKTKFLREQFAECGLITIRYSFSETEQSRVCMNDGQVSLPLRASLHQVELIFHKESGEAILWNGPKLTD